MVPIIRYKSFGYHDGEYIFRGYSYLTTGNSFNPTGNPILTFMIVSFPLMFMDISYPSYEEITNPKIFGLGEFLNYNGNNADLILFWSKIPQIFLGLILGYYLFKWANEIYGFKSSILALVLFTFSPAILTFTGIITTDITAAAFFLPSLYYFWKYFKNGKITNIVLSGIFFGLAVLGKLTVVPLIVSYGILGLIFLFKEKTKFKFYTDKNKIKRFVKLSLILALLLSVSLVTFIIPHLGEIHPIYTDNDPLYLNAGEYRSEERLDKIVAEIFPSSLGDEAKWFLTKVPVPAPHFFQSVYTRHSYSVSGSDDYFMGTYTRDIKWDYVLISFIIKNPIPLLIILLLVIVMYSLIERKNNQDELFIIIPFFVYFLFLMSNNQYGGFRYFLPVICLVFLFSSQITNIKFTNKKTSTIFNIFLIFLVGWYILGTMSVYPNTVVYYNEFVGGPEEGYKYFISWDYDSGSDFYELRDYVQENKLNGFYLNYSYPYALNLVNWNYESLGGKNPVNGTIIINVNALEGQNSVERDNFAWLRNFTPVDRVGYTVFVYNITNEDLNSLAYKL